MTTMVYKAGGPHKFHGGTFEYNICKDEAELEAALDDGWHLTTASASKPKRKSRKASANELD